MDVLKDVFAATPEHRRFAEDNPGFFQGGEIYAASPHYGGGGVVITPIGGSMVAVVIDSLLPQLKGEAGDPKSIAAALNAVVLRGNQFAFQLILRAGGVCISGTRELDPGPSIPDGMRIYVLIS